MTSTRERLLAAYEAWNRGDLERWLDAMHPDIELRNSGIFPGIDPVYRGLDGMRRFWRQIHEPWEEFRIDVERVEEHGDDFVVAIRFRGTGAGSGVEVDMQFGHAIRTREGRAERIVTGPTTAAAVAALASPGSARPAS